MGVNERERGRCGCAGPAWGRVNRENCPKPFERVPQAEKSSGLRLNGCKFTVNKLGPCLRRIWKLSSGRETKENIGTTPHQQRGHIPQGSEATWPWWFRAISSLSGTAAGLGKEIAKGE